MLNDSIEKTKHCLIKICEWPTDEMLAKYARNSLATIARWIKKMTRIDLTEFSLLFNVSRSRRHTNSIQCLFKPDIPQIKDLLQEIKILKESDQTKSLPKGYFERLIYSGWHLFVGTKIYLYGKSSSEDNEDTIIDVMQKDILPLFDEVITLGAEYLLHQRLHVKYKDLKSYVSYMHENGNDLILSNDFHSLDELSKKFDKIAIDYNPEKHKYDHLAINDNVLNFMQHDSVYNRNLFYFSAFGISECHFKYNVYITISEIIRDVYYWYDKPDFEGETLTEYQIEKYHYYIISIWMLIQNIPSNNRTINQVKAYYCLLRKAFATLKWGVDLNEQIAIKLLEYLLQDIKNKSNLINEKDIKRLLGTMEFMGIKTNSDYNVTELFNSVFDESLEQDLLDSACALKNEQTAIRLYEHYFGWIIKNKDFDFEQYCLLDSILDKFKKLNLSIFLEVLAILATINKDEEIAKRAIKALASMLQTSKGNCNISFIYILLFTLRREIVSDDLLEQLYKNINPINAPYSIMQAVNNDTKNIKFIVNSRYINSGGIADNKGYWHEIKFTPYQGMYVHTLDTFLNEKEQFKTREMDDSEIVGKHTNKIAKQAENDFFKLIYVSIKKEKTTVYDYQNSVQNILFLRSSGLSEQFSMFIRKTTLSQK